jgi:nicotinate phosphoribosyltransferase
MGYSALLTDYYELAMAQDYWRQGKAEQRSIFHMFLRRNPFSADFTLAAGLGPILEYLASWQFSADDISYLRSLQTPEGKPSFDLEFLDYLQNLELSVDVWSVTEGQVVFASEPILRVEGPLLQCQILETALMNIINISSLIASKAARVRMAAPQDSAISEFGLRRAQGPNGGLLASRAAYIGGIGSTSNTLAGKTYAIPVLGTIAHSWVLSFASEREAFYAAAKAMGSSTILLVDTFDTIAGTHLAIEVASELAASGVKLKALRLDSGDLCTLSQEVRAILDSAGMQDCKIIASGDLDEYRIHELVQNGAKIDLWGVGTRLATAYDQPALDIAYKLSAIELDGTWAWRAKRSNTAGKASLPGRLQIARQQDGATYQDTIYCEINDSAQGVKLLQPVMQGGQVIYKAPTLKEVHEHTIETLKALHNCKSNVKISEITAKLSTAR